MQALMPESASAADCSLEVNMLATYVFRAAHRQTVSDGNASVNRMVCSVLWVYQ